MIEDWIKCKNRVLFTCVSVVPLAVKVALELNYCTNKVISHQGQEIILLAKDKGRVDL